MNYTYNEDKMMEGIWLYRQEQKAMQPKRIAIQKAPEPEVGEPVTLCRRGHPLNSKNAYEHPGGYITCKVCTAAHVRSYYQRNKEAILAHKREYMKRRKAA